MQARDDLVATAAYQPEPAAAAAARRFVRDTLRTWQVVGRSASQDELVDDAVLLTSELVTNAVVHAGTPVQVTCRLAHGAVEVVVLDRHPVQLVPDREPRDSSGAERTSGRGLMLPSELASSWGVTYARTAKAVWFRLGIADFDAADEAGGTDGPDRAAGAVPRSGASGMLTAAGTVGEGQPAGPDGGPARDRPAGSAQLADGEWPAGSERPGDGRPLADGGQPGNTGRQEITGSQEITGRLGMTGRQEMTGSQRVARSQPGRPRSGRRPASRSGRAGISAGLVTRNCSATRSRRPGP